jgi:transcriptional regulator with XRE-family HTH domain
MEKLTFNDICGERLREERKRLGFTQQEMAELLGVQQVMPGRYERGQAAPGGDVLVAFAANGGDVQYVLTGKRSSHALTSDEEELLTSYRALDIRGKAGMLGMVEGLAPPSSKPLLDKPSSPTNSITGRKTQVIQGTNHGTISSGKIINKVVRKKKDAS